MCVASWQMAIAAVAHVFVFSAEPYHYIPSSSRYEKITTTETTKAEVVNLEEGDSTQAVVERKETQVEAPGTSVTESVQDIVLEGGHHVSSFPINNENCIYCTRFLWVHISTSYASRLSRMLY